MMSNPQPDQRDAAIGRLDDAVHGALRRQGAAGKAILIAVSGGADSTALLFSLTRLASRLDLTLEVATLDHGLRPTSAAEAEAVAVRARLLGLPVHVRALRLAPGAALEQRARDARYAALEDLRGQRGLDLIATAHTASDQAETVLMRLARGAALAGAAGILATRGALIRPMLGVTRAQVLASLAGETWAEDPMNADPAFFRVRVRTQALPALEAAAGPRVVEHLAAFARWAADDDGHLEAEAAAAHRRVTRDGALDAVAVDALALPVRRRVIVRWLRGHPWDVDGALVDDVVEAIAQGRQATLPDDHVLVRRDGWLSAAPAPSRNFTDAPGVRAADAL